MHRYHKYTQSDGIYLPNASYFQPEIKTSEFTPKKKRNENEKYKTKNLEKESEKNERE